MHSAPCAAIVLQFPLRLNDPAKPMGRTCQCLRHVPTLARSLPSVWIGGVQSEHQSHPVPRLFLSTGFRCNERAPLQPRFPNGGLCERFLHVPFLRPFKFPAHRLSLRTSFASTPLRTDFWGGINRLTPIGIVGCTFSAPLALESYHAAPKLVFWT